MPANHPELKLQYFTWLFDLQHNVYNLISYLTCTIAREQTNTLFILSF